MNMSENKGLLGQLLDTVKHTFGGAKEPMEHPDEVFVLKKEDQLTPNPPEAQYIAEIFLDEDFDGEDSFIL